MLQVKTFCCVQTIRRNELHYNRVGIAGAGIKLVTYPTGISNVMVASGLSGTVSLLQVLGSLYNSFCITSIEKLHTSLQDAVDKESYVNDNITKTVSEVKQRLSIKETTATTGPEGTVSIKLKHHLNLTKECSTCTTA